MRGMSSPSAKKIVIIWNDVVYPLMALVLARRMNESVSKVRWPWARSLLSAVLHSDESRRNARLVFSIQTADTKVDGPSHSGQHGSQEMYLHASFFGSKVMMKCTRGQMPVDTEFLRSTDDVRDNRLVNKVLVYRLKNLKLKIYSKWINCLI